MRRPGRQWRASRIPGRRTARALAIIGSLAACATSATGARAATAPPPPKPPSVYTGYASPASASSTTIRARINPHGLATEYHFEYGPTTAYGSQTASATAGSGTRESLLAQAITGLEAYTTYHYRAIATNSAGMTVGQDATFKTKKIPLSLAITSDPNPVVFGSPLGVSGTLSGTGNAGVEVVLQGDPFPYTHGFHNLTSPEQTSATGAFSFPVAGLLESTQLRAATLAKPPILSAVITELVTVRVTFHVRPARRHGFVRLYGTVTPSEPGVSVAFERLDKAHRYVPVSGTTVRAGTSGVSRFSRTVRLRRRGLYRALIPIPNGAQVSGRSRSILIR
jgi:hypothetical protein